jgi:hypothetical protein
VHTHESELIEDVVISRENPRSQKTNDIYIRKEARPSRHKKIKSIYKSLSRPHATQASLKGTDLDLSIPSTALYTLRALRRASARNILAAESAQHTRISARKRTGAAICVLLAIVSKVLLARARAAVAVEQLATQTGLLRLDDVLENIAFRNDLCAGVGFERVLGVGVEVVVHGVQQRVARDLGRTARSVVDVVFLQRNKVVGASEVHAPVVVAVASRRPAGCAVDVAVGNRDAVRGGVAEDDVLAGDEVGCYVIDPDEVA